jgi:hypothetical protein
MPSLCDWPGGCANDPDHQVPDGVPVFSLTKIDSDEIDGLYCRVHAQLRASQMGRERREARRAETAQPEGE